MDSLRWASALLVCMGLTLGGTTPAKAEDGPALSATSVIARDTLLSDATLLQEAYEALHPGLYRYNTREQMDAHFAALRQSLGRDQTLAEAYLAFSLFAAQVRCGHTYPNFYNQPKAHRQVLFEQGSARVPFHFRWLDSRMVVLRDLTGRGLLPPGSVVLSIDGVDSAKILASMMRIARADGGNDAKRRALLEVRGLDEYETFDIYLPLLFPQVDAQLELSVRVPGQADPATVSVAGHSFAQRQASRAERPEGDTAGWSFDASSPQLAVLRMPGWALYNSKWDWKGFLREAFDTLAQREAQTLVIDLRGNEGGLDVGEEIVPHLIERELRIAAPEARVRYRRVPDALVPALDTWDRSFDDWGEAAVPHDDRFFNLLRGQKSTMVKIQPRAPRFRGRVFVLVGADNSSATFGFAQQLQQAGLATLVGQPTGGNQRGINGGAFYFLRLPGSGIELDLPLIATFPAGDPPDAGLQPDILVEPEVDDIARGHDAEMEAIRRVLSASVRWQPLTTQLP